MRLIGKSEVLLEQMVLWQRDDVMRIKCNGTTVPLSDDFVRTYYDQHYDGYQNMLVGVESDSQEIVGAFLIEDIDRRNCRCYMHIQFSPQGRQKCLKTACTSMANFTFTELHMRQILGIISEDNVPALRFIDKMGWKRISIMPDYFSSSFGWKDGILVRLVPEWRKF